MEIGDYKLYVAYIYQKLTHKHGFMKYTLRNSSEWMFPNHQGIFEDWWLQLVLK